MTTGLKTTAISDSKLLFEKSKSGKEGIFLPSRKFQDDFSRLIPADFQRKDHGDLPEITEPELVRHFVNLSKKNFSVDTHFYPLGSCTMKYNPKIHEDVASLDGFAWLNPSQTEDQVQGILQIFHELSRALCELTGMDEFTLQPAAGAHGELCGMMLTRAYHHSRGEGKRHQVLVPDSSHGTNPASAAQYGYEVVQIPSDARGRVDLKALEDAMSDRVACLMLTNPNTLGLFENDILKIREIVHRKGALLYYDGANLNALLGAVRPGDMGFDIVHLNLHKTFTTPHGGGGPGAGPVGVKKILAPFLPAPLVVKQGSRYGFDYHRPKSIGKVRSFFGNAGILLRAYVYIRMLGLEGLKRVSHDAVLSANYLRKKLSTAFLNPHNEFCMHEFVLSASNLESQNIHAGDIGKRLLDYGIHAPTVHFPLVVKEALMIEPTETESKETLDAFVEVMLKILKEAQETPELVRKAPHTMPIGRPDEVQAARKPILSFRDLKRDTQASPL
ncbi:MAG: glycine dehydrogenase (aminomethyl-transferring) [Omnitrophica bacterium RIFCSPHIGHO2_02_FULL_46_11]|nr:MAG: glycine dehydrogenase (aminomethyl-transferring) [Omnitrophica bacterium RIFCSPHIGHO2_02_FULL_46_11]OGW85918.1 MAG: glycine dehydrogenase (aminomethyl-transferring) [Omnitrophica bacterium RIFCSPLOWO2_01_FULL_45_10b]